MSWEMVKLGDIFEVCSSKRVLQKDWRKEGIPFYRAREIVLLSKNGYVNNELFIEPSMFDEYKSKYGAPEFGDILITAVGTLGQTYIVRKDDQFYFKDASVLWLKKKIEVDTKYIHYAIKSKDVQRFIQNSNGATVGTYTIARAKETLIPLPPLDEQKRIAAILDKADAIRQKRKQAIALADDFLRSVFLDMFGDPVTNPKGWEVKPLSDIADVITGHAFKSDKYTEDSVQAVRLCRGANTLTGYLDWTDTVFYEKSDIAHLDNYRLKNNDIVLAMDRPWISSGLKVCKINTIERDTYLVQRVARIRCNDEIFNDYVYSYIKSMAFEIHCKPTETTVPHISPIELKNFNIMIPDNDLLNKYVEITSKIIKKTNNQNIQLAELNKMFNSLSQKAFSGQI